MPRGRPKLTPEEKAKRKAEREAAKSEVGKYEEILAKRDRAFSEQNTTPKEIVTKVGSQFYVEVVSPKPYTLDDGSVTPPSEWIDAGYEQLVRTLPHAEEIKKD